MNKKLLINICKVLIYATFFVPLLVLPSSFIFPFIVPKILVLRSLITLMIGSYVLLLIDNWQEYKPKLTALNIALLAFLLSFAISTFVGVDVYHSFWDNHERMLGLFTIFHYVAYYFVCSAVFKGWSEWRLALWIFLVAGSIAMFIGLLQVGNPDLLLNQGNPRVASTLGNSIYVGGYGLFLIFVCALFFLKDKSLVGRWLAGGLALLALLGIFYSGTRGSMLGLAAGIGMVMVGYIIALKKFPRVRITLSGLILLMIVLLGVIYVNRQSKFVSSLPAVGRLVNTSWQEISSGPRMIAWKIAFESWQSRPVFGWGPNNFFYAFNSYYNPRSLEFGYGETWFDNAHNIIMNTLAVQGAVGIVTYLAIFAIGVLSLVISYRRKQVNMHIAVVGSAFLVAHLVQNVTVFENPTSYLYFMFWLAFINQLSSSDLKKEQSAPLKNEQVTAYVDKKASLALAGVVLGVALIVVFIFDVQPGRANSKTLDALRALGKDPVTGVTAMRVAMEFNSPHIDDIRSDLARSAITALGNIYKAAGKDKSNEVVALTREALKANVALHPLDVRNYLALAQLLQIVAQLNNDTSYLQEAQDYLQDAVKYSPRRQQTIYALATVDAQLGKVDAAVKLLEATITDNANIGEGYWRLAYIYTVFGQPEKAKEVMALADTNKVVFSDQEKQFISQAIFPPKPTTTPTKK